jgi:hypothetical protein
MPHDDCARAAGEPARLVDRPVVDDDDLAPGGRCSQRADDVADG